MVALVQSKKILFSLITFLLAAPVWSPYLQQLKGRNMFLSADSMVWLGVSLLVGWICIKVLPDELMSFIEKFKPWIRERMLVVVILFLSFFLYGLYIVNQHILHSFMNSADEHSCFFLAECIRMGKWWVSSPPLEEFFKVVHVGMRDGKWFSVYPPGWPLLLAALPSQRGGLLDFTLFLTFNTSFAIRIIFLLLQPANAFVPRRIVIGRSVLSLRVKHGMSKQALRPLIDE